MFNLFKSKEKERLYKVTFKRPTSYSRDITRTLLVTARDTIDAVNEFYNMINYDVDEIDITEFTEIKLDGLEGIKADGK